MLLYSLVKFRVRKDAVPAQIRGNTRLEVGWTLGAAGVLVILAIVTFAMLGDIRTPPNSDADGYPTPVVANIKTASAFQPRAAQRPLAEDPRQRPALHLALHVPRRRRERPQQRLLLRRDGRADEDDRHAGHRGPGRRALVVDPRARRQGRRDPRAHELHVVQDRQAGRLPRPVRRAVRAQPRRHGRPGACGRRRPSSRPGWRTRSARSTRPTRPRSRAARPTRPRPRTPSRPKAPTPPRGLLRRNAEGSLGEHAHRDHHRDTRPDPRDHRPRRASPSPPAGSRG